MRLKLSAVAVLVGIGCSLVLMFVELLAEELEHLVWGNAPDTWWSTVAILTLTGVAVGLVVAFVPGHAGHDPATEGLIAPPLPVYVLPGLALAAILALAGGVSLGPENPITAINIALAVTLLRKPGPATGLALAGTVGALFGTPVAAALLLSEMPSDSSEPLWDRLFYPLLSAGAGALTTVMVASPVFAVDVPAYPGFQLIDLVSATGISLAAGLIGLAIIYPFPLVHRLFHRIRHPVAMMAVSGFVLGLLGAVGGIITLFKGLEQSKELVQDVGAYTTGGLALVVIVKCAALLVSASGSFRGGRIFPTVFIGVAIGLLAQRLFPSIPLALAIGCGVLGIAVAITHQGWLSLFLAAALVTDIRLIPVLCLAVLPVWLLTSRRPEMQIQADQHRP